MSEHGWTVAMASRFYRVPLVDLGTSFRDGSGERRGVLLGSGCGLMMALMDTLPFRYCRDTDDIREILDTESFRSFCQMADEVEGIALAGWFSFSDPTPLVAAFRMLPRAPVYSGGMLLPVSGRCDSLEHFIQRCRERLSHTAYPKRSEHPASLDVASPTG